MITLVLKDRYEGLTHKPFVVKINNVGVNLTGYQVKCEFRKRAEDAVPAFSYSTSAGTISIGGVNQNEIFFSLRQDITAPACESYTGDIIITSPSGDDEFICRLIVRIKKTYTRP